MRLTPRPKLRFSSKPLALLRGPISRNAAVLLRHSNRWVVGSVSAVASTGASAASATGLLCSTDSSSSLTALLLGCMTLSATTPHGECQTVFMYRDVHVRPARLRRLSGVLADRSCCSCSGAGHQQVVGTQKSRW